MRMRTSGCAAALLVAWCAAGCARRRPPPPVEPPLRVEVGHALGSPVDPPPPAGAAGGDALVVTVTGYAVAPRSLPPGEPLAARGRLIVDSVNEPMATAPPMAETVRLVADASALPAPRKIGRRAVAVDEVSSPVPPGCSTSIAFHAEPGVAGAGDHATLRLVIVSPSAAGSDRPRLLVTARPRADAPAVPGETPAPSRQRTMLLDWPLDGPTGEFALIFPPLDWRAAGHATVFRIGVARAEAGSDAMAASARIVADLNRAAKPAGPTRGQMLASTLTAAAAMPPVLRARLAATSSEVRAEVTSEAALLLEDRDLAALAAPVAGALAAAPADAETSQLGWLADRAVLTAVAKLATGGDVPPGVRAMLAARFGEVGRDAGLVSDLATASPTRADFDTRVRAENLIFLEDASPASRVRAFEWIRPQDAQGALKGYDPMGPPPQRRQAIEQYLQSLTPATQPTTRAAEAAGVSHD